MKKTISLLLCAVLILALVASCAKPAVPLSSFELLNLGEKFLLEFDYEQAIVQFLAVIEIEPMNARAYLGAAEAYIGLDDTPAAISILTQGLAATDDAAIAAMLARLTPPPHEHTWTDATHWQPATCAECGETDGDMLPAALADKTFMREGKSYDYYTVAYRDPSLEVIGDVTITSYNRTEGNPTYLPMEGYEWLIVRSRMLFTAEKADLTKGIMTRGAELFYYTGEDVDYYTDAETDPDSDEDFFTIDYNGEVVICRFLETEITQAWSYDGNSFQDYFEQAFQVPVGYDGIVLAFHSGAHESDHEDFDSHDLSALLADPNTLYFRLD